MPSRPLRPFFDTLGARGAKEDPLLVEAVGLVLERAKSKYPGLGFSDADFLVRLAERVRESSGMVGMLNRLRTSDLYVAWAAERGESAAIAAILENARRTLNEALTPMGLDRAERDEVLQRLQQRIFTGTPPRIGQYSGTGSLATWLSATAVRLAIDLKRSARPEEELDEALASAVADGSDVELQLIRKQFQPEFREAFRAAFHALTLDERNLVRLTFIDRLGIDALAAMTGLHRSTVARRIAALRDELAKGTRKRLQEKYRLSASDVNSLMRVVVSAFDASLNSLLGEPGRAKPKR